MSITPFPHGISSFGIPIYGNGSQDISGSTYFVDGNSGLDSNDGSSWENAFKTLAKAFAISHADIARGSDRWARRNTIYAAGDAFTEDLVVLPQKTDVIGVGSYDGFQKAGIIGNHVPVNTAYGCRLINFQFRGDSSGGDMFTLVAGNSGLGFYGCDFHADGGTAATGAILGTAVRFLTVEGCHFNGAFSDAVIELAAGNGGWTIIRNNIIEGANQGIDVKTGFTSSAENSYIIGNVFKTTLACINDTDGVFHLIDNRGITAANKGASLAGAVVGNTDLSAGNLFTCADANNVVWPAYGTI